MSKIKLIWEGSPGNFPKDGIESKEGGKLVPCLAATPAFYSVVIFEVTE